MELKPADEIIEFNGGHCPKCGKELVFEIEGVEITALETP